MPEVSDEAASRYFDVRIEWQKDGRLGLGVRNFGAVVADFLSWGIFGGVAQAKSTVQVFRKSDGATLAEFQHVRNDQALRQVDDLRYRLANRSLSDMCAQLGISRVDVGEAIED